MALVWSLLPGVLPLTQFDAETWDFVRAWQGLSFEWAGLKFAPLFGAFWVGVLFLVWRGGDRSANLLLSGVLYCGLLLLYLLLGLVSDVENSPMSGALPSLFLGLTSGALVGALLSRSAGFRSRLAWLPTQNTVLRLWPWLAGMPFLLTVLPLAGESSLSHPVYNAFLDLPERIYQLIRALILWLPVGLVVAFAGHGRMLRVWALAGLATLPLVVNVGLFDLPWRDLMNLLAALPGLAAGVWLVERGGFSELVAAEPGLRVTAPVRVSSSPSARAPEVTPSAPEPVELGWQQPGLASITLAGLLVLGVLTYLVDFPFWPVLLGVVLAAYCALLWFQPLVWLLVVPAALPLLDLAPWSGRFFFDEFDLLLAVTLAVLMLRGRPRSALSWPPLARVLMAGFFSLALISGLIGLADWPPLDANAFSSYWSSYNGLRVAKGMFWGAIFLFLVRRTGLDLERFSRWLAVGMGLGVLSACLIGVWQGGLDSAWVYLAASLPFLWLGMRHWQPLLLTLPLLALVVYVLMYFGSANNAWVFGLIFIILAVGSARLAWLAREARVHRLPQILPLWLPMLLSASLAMVFLVAAVGGYISQGQTHADDNAAPQQHATRDILAMTSDSWSTAAFGMGLGSFPRVFLQRGAPEQRPATYGFVASRTGQALRLGTGVKLDYAQRVKIEPNSPYLLQVDARAEGVKARLQVPLCSKPMRHSAHCVVNEIEVPGDGVWRRYHREINSGEVGAGSLLTRFSTEIALSNVGSSGLLEIDNVRLLDVDGQDQLCNGRFEAAGDCWLMRTQHSLPWQIERLWLHLVFEMGWLGLGAFLALAGLALARVVKAAWRGQYLAWVLLASVSGLFGMGLFVSLLDAPRLTMLLMGFILIALAPPWAPRLKQRRRTKRSSRHANVIQPRTGAA